MKDIIIGVGGEANSGKDTVASMINYITHVGITRAKYDQWITKRKIYDDQNSDRILHFADNPKKAVSIIYNIPIEYFYDRRYKDDLYYCISENRFIKEEDLSYKYVEITIDDLSNNSLANIIEYIEKPNLLTVYAVIKLRTLLQYFGTDICRTQLGLDIWVASTKKKAVDIVIGRKICIIPDVRFQNESDAILSSPFRSEVIKLVGRNSTSDKHESEDCNFSYTKLIENTGTLFELYYKIIDILAKIK